MMASPLFAVFMASTISSVHAAAAPAFRDLLRGHKSWSDAHFRVALLQRGAVEEPEQRLGGGTTPEHQPKMVHVAEGAAKSGIFQAIVAVVFVLFLAGLIGFVTVWCFLRRGGAEARGREARGRAEDLMNLRTGILADLEQLKKDKRALKGGSVESEGGYIRAGPSSVTSVAGMAGSHLDRLEMNMHRSDAKTYGAEKGNAELPRTELGQCEYLSAVEQYSKDDSSEGKLGGGLKFTTSLGRTIDFSGEQVDRDHYVRYAAEVGSEIVGLRFEGTQLHGIMPRKLPIVVTINV